VNATFQSRFTEYLLRTIGPRRRNRLFWSSIGYRIESVLRMSAICRHATAVAFDGYGAGLPNTVRLASAAALGRDFPVVISLAPPACRLILRN
jgi:hypothetical protein